MPILVKCVLIPAAALIAGAVSCASLWAQEKVISEGDTWKYFKGTTQPPADWNQLGFDDSPWESGATPMGYGNDLPYVTLLPDMQMVPGENPGYLTVYARKSLNLLNASVVKSLRIGLKFDDGCIVYLNGIEVLRKSMPAGPVTKDTTAYNHDANLFFDHSTIPCAAVSATLLETGENILAIEGHNVELASADYFLSVEIELITGVCPTNLTCELRATGQVLIRWSKPPGFIYDNLSLLRNGVRFDPGPLKTSTSYFDRIPLPGINRYHLVAVACGEECTGSDAPTCSVAIDANGEIQPLAADDPVPLSLTPTRYERLFYIQRNTSRPILITLDSTDPQDTNELFFRWDSAPTTGTWDHMAAERGQASQRLVTSPPWHFDGFLLVRASRFGGGQNDATVLFRQPPFAIESVSTHRSPINARATATIHGAGFRPGMRISLGIPPQFPIYPADQVTVASDRRIDFEVSVGASPRVYDILCEDPSTGKVESLPRAWTVEPKTHERGFLARLTGRNAYRGNTLARLTLEYENSGNIEIAAPLLVLRAPSFVKLRLESDGDFAPWSSNVLQIIAANPLGPSGRLPPGFRGSIPIVFKSTELGAALFTLESLLPNKGDYIGWERLQAPDGFVPEEWLALRSPMSLTLGATWREYQESLARRSTILGRNGVDPTSARSALELTVLEASARLGHFVLRGWLRQSAAVTPIPGVSVGAFVDGTLVSNTVSDADGHFVLECLEADNTYDLRANGYVLDPASFRISPGIQPKIMALAANADPLLTLGKSACNTLSRPRRIPPLPPTRVLSKLGEHRIQFRAGMDPNEKTGPDAGIDDLVGREEEIEYVIHFENVPAPNSGPVRVVIVEDDLDPNLDWLSFKPLNACFGAQQSYGLDRQEKSGLVVPSSAYNGRRLLAGVIPDSQRQYRSVETRCDYNEKTGKAIWTFATVHAETGELPPEDDIDEGFLPPNAVKPEGEGWVSFSVRPSHTAAENAEIINDAIIRFDRQPSITTKKIRLTLRSRTVPLPTTVFDPPVPADITSDPGMLVEVDVYFSWARDPHTQKWEAYLWTGGPRPGSPTAIELASPSFQPLEELSPDTEYQWQVVAVRTDGSRQDGPPWRFRTTPERSPPAPPILVSPSDGATEVLRRPTLVWSPVESALGYTVFLWRDGEEENRLITGVTGSDYRISLPLEPLATYFWRVASENGSTHGLSEVWRFHTGTLGGPRFLRGDADGDGQKNITDAIYTLGYLFLGTAPPQCLAASDFNDDTKVNIVDPTVLLAFLFTGGPPLPEPFEACGEDATPQTGEACARSSCE